MSDVNDPPDDLGRRLIDHAAKLLAADGMAALSLRKVAAAAGTSTMSVYTRFGGKQQLLAAMFREGFRRFGAELTGSADPDPLTALTQLGRAYRRAALAAPELYGLMFGPPAHGFEPDPADEAAARATYQPLVDGVRAAVDAGVLTGDPERTARHLWSVTHGTVSLEIAGLVELSAADYDEALYLAAAPFLAGP